MKVQDVLNIYLQMASDTFAGALLCRGIIERFSTLNVDNFISIAGPQAGQFGGRLHSNPP